MFIILSGRFMGYEKGEDLTFCVKPILGLRSGVTASHPVYLISADLDHLLYALLAKQALAKFFEALSGHFGTSLIIT